MRRLLGLALALLVSCGHAAKPAASPAQDEGGMPEGAMCGGFAGLVCKRGLYCGIPDTRGADRGGVCKKSSD